MKFGFNIKLQFSTLLLLLILLPSNRSFAQDSLEVQATNDTRDEVTFYLIKSYWHTGLIFSVDSTLLEHIDALRNFDDKKFVDIGWGDEDFYQNPSDFDLYLASKAILIPTNSVIRIAGYLTPIESIIRWSDFCIKFKFTKIQFQKLCNFINTAFERNDEGNLIITSKTASGGIAYYKSIYKYHLLNTCNTWVANALKFAGLDISPSNVIRANELFFEVKDFGEVLKFEE